MIKVFDHPLSPFAQKVKIALREKGVDFELVQPMAGGDPQIAAEFAQANPLAEVPTFVHDGTTLFESSVILEYIEDTWPEPSLLETSPQDRARARLIEVVMDTQYEAINWGLGELHSFRRAEGSLLKTLLDRAAEQTSNLQAWLSRHLQDANWFCENRFSRADICVFPCLNASEKFGLAPGAGSGLNNWLERMRERPSVQKTVQETLPHQDDLERGRELIEQGLFVREYRDHRLEWMIRSGGVSVVNEGLDAGTIRFSHEFK